TPVIDYADIEFDFEEGDVATKLGHVDRLQDMKRLPQIVLPSVRESRTPPVALLKALFATTWTAVKASSWTDSIEKPDFSTLQSLAGDGAPVAIVTRETRP